MAGACPCATPCTDVGCKEVTDCSACTSQMVKSGSRDNEDLSEGQSGAGAELGLWALLSR